MHTQIHIIQADLKFSESIKYFYDHTNSLTGDTKQYGGDFIHQHIHWHIAIAYLFEDSVSEKIVATSENFSKSIGLYKIVLTTYYHDTECFVNIFGYLVWVYLRSQGEINIIFFLENQIISESNLNKFKSIISDPTNYTKHTLFDYFSVWLLKELKMEEELINVRNQINQNIEEINNHAKVTEEAKKFYSEVYPKIISAFSDNCLLSKESDKLLKECQKYFYFNSGSKEQTSILEEILKRLG